MLWCNRPLTPSFLAAIQTIGDNPVTAYRQLVQQYAKGLNGAAVDPKVAAQEAKAVFKANPVTASLSGLLPRIIGVVFKRVPKFGFLLGYTTLTGLFLPHASTLAASCALLCVLSLPKPSPHGQPTYIIRSHLRRMPAGNTEPGYGAAVFASVFSAYAINPVRMVEKQQRAFLKQTGKEKAVGEILREAYSESWYLRPLFRGTLPLILHSMASAMLGLVGQPQLQKLVQKELGSKTQLGQSASNLVASSVVSPIYVFVTNPISRLEVIMQTNSIKSKEISLVEAIKEVTADSKQFGVRGVFRGQGIGMAKAILSLSLFHEGRMLCQRSFKSYNEGKGEYHKEDPRAQKKN